MGEEGGREGQDPLDLPLGISVDNFAMVNWAVQALCLPTLHFFENQTSLFPRVWFRSLGNFFFLLNSVWQIYFWTRLFIEANI